MPVYITNVIYNKRCQRAVYYIAGRCVQSEFYLFLII